MVKSMHGSDTAYRDDRDLVEGADDALGDAAARYDDWLDVIDRGEDATDYHPHLP